MGYDVYARAHDAPAAVIVSTGSRIPDEAKPDGCRYLFTADDVASSLRREIDAKGWVERPYAPSTGDEALRRGIAGDD